MAVDERGVLEEIRKENKKKRWGIISTEKAKVEKGTGVTRGDG